MLCLWINKAWKNYEKFLPINLEVSENLGLISYLELPNFLVTKYKKVFHSKKWSYKVHRIEIIINFARERVNVEMLKAVFNRRAAADINTNFILSETKDLTRKTALFLDATRFFTTFRMKADEKISIIINHYQQNNKHPVKCS